MKNPLRVGLVGFGDWGEKHLQALLSIPEVEVVGVCEKNPERARLASSSYGITKTFSDYHDLYKLEGIDAVHVVTPEPSHRDPVVDALSHGIEVLVEKPLATSLEDADAMINSAKDNSRILMVGHILRWDARYAMVKDAIDAKEIEDIASIFARRSSSRALAPTFLNRSTPMMQLGIHDIDLILWYTGSKVTEVNAKSSRFLDFKYPDSTTCFMQFENGARALVENSFSLPAKMPFFVGARMEILSRKGFTVVDASEQSLFILDEKGYRTPDTTLMPKIRGKLSGTLREEIQYFVRCVACGQKPSVITPGESREALRVALACEKSMFERRPTSLS